MFSVGDIIQKKQDLSQRFIILSIRTEDGMMDFLFVKSQRY